MIFPLILLFIVAILIGALSLIWPPDSPWAPQWRIKRSAARIALKFAAAGKGDVVYELGCGDAEFVLTAAEEFSTHSVGIEIDPIRYLISWVRAQMSRARKNIQIVRKDFKKVDLSEATLVYMYLVPDAMKRILPQLKNQLPKGARIISYRYKIPLDKTEKKIRLKKEQNTDKIFLYIIT